MNFFIFKKKKETAYDIAASAQHLDICDLLFKAFERMIKKASGLF